MALTVRIDATRYRERSLSAHRQPKIVRRPPVADSGQKPRQTDQGVLLAYLDGRARVPPPEICSQNLRRQFPKLAVAWLSQQRSENRA